MITADPLTPPVKLNSFAILVTGRIRLSNEPKMRLKAGIG
jgi:hypothetical protein